MLILKSSFNTLLIISILSIIVAFLVVSCVFYILHTSIDVFENKRVVPLKTNVINAVSPNNLMQVDNQIVTPNNTINGQTLQSSFSYIAIQLNNYKLGQHIESLQNIKILTNISQELPGTDQLTNELKYLIHSLINKCPLNVNPFKRTYKKDVSIAHLLFKPLNEEYNKAYDWSKMQAKAFGPTTALITRMLLFEAKFLTMGLLSQQQKTLGYVAVTQNKY